MSARVFVGAPVLHGDHPLWFGRDDAWWCASDDVKVAALGTLPVYVT